MSYLPYEMMQKLKRVHFSFPDYEHFLNLGMVYYYRGNEYFIGGSSSSDFTKTEEVVAADGCWLPNDSQLLEWLRLVEFDVHIHLDASSQNIHVEAIDCVNNTRYGANGPLLVYALANLIYKICKSNLRDYSPKQVNRIAIDPSM